VPLWASGELFIGGASVARGYLHDDQTDAKFLADPFAPHPADRMYRTGDRVRVLPGGTLEFLGRVDTQVKIRGFRVEPGEVESTLSRHPAVAGSAVVVGASTADETRLKAFVVIRPDSSVSTTDLMGWLKSELPDYMHPARLVALDALPLTANGKVDRQALSMLSDSAEQEGSSEPPATTWEIIVADVWRELLSIEQVSLDDNFYDLGGHSLMAIQVVAALEKRMGVQISPRDLVFHTLRQFAALCASRAATEPRGVQT
jgi:acyl carrier protein